MNKAKDFLLAVAVAAMAFTISCESEGGGGTLTMTDIPPEYNGKWVYIGVAQDASADEDDDDSLILQGYQSAKYKKEGGLDIYGVRISGGKASIPMWNLTGEPDFVNGPRYSGNHTIGFLGAITDSATSIMESTVLASFSAVVKFKNGSATIAWSNMRTMVGAPTLTMPKGR